jgi:hypothetical protein
MFLFSEKLNNNYIFNARIWNYNKTEHKPTIINVLGILGNKKEKTISQEINTFLNNDRVFFIRILNKD